MKRNMKNTEKLTSWLAETIYNETQKPFEEIDHDLIDECDNFLRTLNESQPLSDIEVKRIMAKIKKPQKKTHKFSKGFRNFVAASIAVVHIGCISVVGYSSLPSIQELFNSGIEGHEPYQHNVEYRSEDKKRTYRSLERVMIDNNLELPYPKKWVAEMGVRRIRDYIDSEGVLVMDLISNSTIRIEYNTEKELPLSETDYETVIVDGITFYTDYEVYSRFGEIRYRAHAIIDGNYYLITCPTKDLLALALTCFEE